ncbi:MAG: Delta(1)-pyrroline-2-carboxylate reductase [Elusimicrobia bacterium]|nr:Delta(1)-pyrroline-2-carboxylate reductase [Elusimicrobiota bacterium]
MKIGSELLWLSEDDVRSLLTMDEALHGVEAAFRLHGEKQTQMPTKIYLEFDPYGGDLRAMPAYLKGDMAAAGVKIVNSNPSNPSQGLPAVAGIMVFVDPRTGLPLGLFGAGHLTAMRTGAAGGIAARYLARASSSTVGLIGCGRQAETQFAALRKFFPVQRVLVWGKTKQESETFCLEVKKKIGGDDGSPGPEIISVGSVEEACQVDILVTTTPVREPLVKAAWVKPGTHINAIGADAPGKQELEFALVKSARVVVDEWHQASHAGEINVPVAAGQFLKKDLAAQLGEIVTGQKQGRLKDQDITVFDSTGLAIQDVAVSKIIFDKAVKLNKGQVLKIHG